MDGGDRAAKRRRFADSEQQWQPQSVSHLPPTHPNNIPPNEWKQNIETDIIDARYRYTTGVCQSARTPGHSNGVGREEGKTAELREAWEAQSECCYGMVRRISIAANQEPLAHSLTAAAI